MSTNVKMLKLEKSKVHINIMKFGCRINENFSIRP